MVVWVDWLNTGEESKYTQRMRRYDQKKVCANRQCCHYALQMEANEDIWVETTINHKPQSYYAYAQAAL